METWSAIVLSGGTNKRFGSDKSAALLHSVTLLSALFSQLLNAISADAAMPVDADGFKQPLCGIYRRAALLSAIEKLGNPHGQSMRALCELLVIDEVHVDARALIDIDTPEDLISAHSSPRLTGL